MDPNELVQQARDALTVKRVFGEPYERDGVAVIPAASVEVLPVGEAVRAAAPVGRAALLGRAVASVLSRSPLGRLSSAEVRCGGGRR